MKTRLKSDYVKELLIRHNVSQNSMAQGLHISSGYLSQLLGGARCPSPRLRPQIMDYLSCDFDTVFEIVKTDPQ